MTSPFLFAQTTLIRAVSYFLFHSIWIGIVLALLASMILVCTRKTGSRLRYGLLLGATGLFTVSMTGVFVYLLQPIFKAAEAGITAGSVTTVFNGYNNEQSPLLWYDQLDRFLNLYATPIVMVWMVIVLLRLVRLAYGLAVIRDLRHRNLLDVEPQWLNRIASLAAELGITKVVRLARSASVEVPMVIGHFKPIVLVPVQLFNSLTAEEAEAVLLHELAHIVRKDYLVNLMLNIIETIFFFNPAVIWVHTLLRKERENCCDDLAIEHAASRETYINALLNCQSGVTGQPALAPALFTKPKLLLDRITRILYNRPNPSINNMEKSLLSIAALVAFLVAVSFNSEPETSIPDTGGSSMQVPKGDVSSKSSAQWLNTLSLVQVPGDNRDTVPANRKHSKTVTSTTTHSTGTPMKFCLPEPAPAPPSTGLPAIPGMPTPVDASAAPLNTVLPSSPPMPSAPAYPSVLPAQSTVSPSVPPVHSTKSVPISPIAPLAPAAPSRLSVDVSVPVNVEVEALEPAHAPVPPAPATDSYSDEIVAELKRDGVISGSDNLSFKLSSTSFEVNGKKQTDELHRKYLKKYAMEKATGNWSWYYKRDSKTTTR